MVVVLFVLALLLIGTGSAALFGGIPNLFQAERGVVMVQSGTVLVTGGILLVGAAVIARRLGRIATQLVVLRSSLDGLLVPRAAERLEPEPFAEEPPVRDMLAPPLPPTIGVPADPVEAPAPEVVGRYASGSNSYVMFADGSVQADTPGGRHRFASLDELRAFVAAGGEREAVAG